MSEVPSGLCCVTAAPQYLLNETVRRVVVQPVILPNVEPVYREGLLLPLTALLVDGSSTLIEEIHQNIV